MQEVIQEAIKQALKFFGGKGGSDTLAKGAEEVVKTAAKVAARAAKKGK